MNYGVQEAGWAGKNLRAEFILKVSPKIAALCYLHSPNYGIIRFRASGISDKSKIIYNTYMERERVKKIPDNPQSHCASLPGKSGLTLERLIIHVLFKDSLLAQESLPSLRQIPCLHVRDLLLFRGQYAAFRGTGLDRPRRATSLLVTCERSATEMQAAQFQL